MEVPSDIQERYLERRKHDLEECLLFLDRKNFGLIEKIGHQLKGNAATFGYPQLSSIGDELEVGAKRQDSILIEAALEQFAKWINSQPS